MGVGLQTRMEDFLQLGSNALENVDDFARRLETNPENILDNEILAKFDENQLEYINSIQENPLWTEMTITEKIASVKEAVGKFCHNTEIGKYWSNPSHWTPIVHCLIKCMSRI